MTVTVSDVALMVIQGVSVKQVKKQWPLIIRKRIENPLTNRISGYLTILKIGH